MLNLVILISIYLVINIISANNSNIIIKRFKIKVTESSESDESSEQVITDVPALVSDSVLISFTDELKQIALYEFNEFRSQFALGNKNGFNSATQMLTLVKPYLSLIFFFF